MGNSIVVCLFKLPFRFRNGGEGTGVLTAETVSRGGGFSCIVRSVTAWPAIVPMMAPVWGLLMMIKGAGSRLTWLVSSM